MGKRRLATPDLLQFFHIRLVTKPFEAPPVQIRRGDANADGNFDISDPVAILTCLFLGATCSGCPDASDSNDDGILNLTDPVYLAILGSLRPERHTAANVDTNTSKTDTALQLTPGRR